MRIIAIVVLYFVIAAPALAQLQAVAGTRADRQHNAIRVKKPLATLPSAPSAVATTLAHERFQNLVRQNSSGVSVNPDSEEPVVPRFSRTGSSLYFSFRPKSTGRRVDSPQEDQPLNSEPTDYAVGRYLFRSLPETDPNYRPVETGSVWQRTGYAISRVLVGRSEDGRTIPKGTYLLGAMVLSLLATADRPDRPFDHHNPSDALGNFGSAVGSDAGKNLIHEFWPQIRHQLVRHARPVQNIGNSLLPGLVPAR